MPKPVRKHVTKQTTSKELLSPKTPSKELAAITGDKECCTMDAYRAVVKAIKKDPAKAATLGIKACRKADILEALKSHLSDKPAKK